MEVDCIVARNVGNVVEVVEEAPYGCGHASEEQGGMVIAQRCWMGDPGTDMRHSMTMYLDLFVRM